MSYFLIIMNFLNQSFESMTFRSRDKRLKKARLQSDRRVRELKRDQKDLQKRENILMVELRNQITRGDMPKVKMVANQLAHFKDISDRNFARSLYLQSEAQIRKSNNSINQAHAEFLKGMEYVNKSGTVEQMRQKQARVAKRQDGQEMIESMMYEGFEEVWEHIEEDRPTPYYFDEEVTGILRTAMDPKLTKRKVNLHENDSFRKVINVNKVS